MASPHVAGVAALFLEANPRATPAAVAAALINSATADQVSDVKARLAQPAAFFTAQRRRR